MQDLTIPYPLPPNPYSLPPNPSMQVALFGTSADPPTIAHREIISWLGAYFDRVAVWAADNPYKAHGATLAQRSQMLELLIGEIEPEIAQDTQVYPELSSRRSIESVDRAKQIWNDADFILVVGADLLAQLPQWYRVDKLFSQVKLLVVPRSGNSIDPNSIDNLLKLGAKVAIAPLATPPVSSTIVRTNHSHLSPTKSALEGLTPAVAKYIQTQELYKL
jgi:nicotinate-nucleotide adenylyltransferase